MIKSQKMTDLDKGVLPQSLVDLVMRKSKDYPDSFYNDFLKYVKLLLLEACPKNKKDELITLVRKGTMGDLFKFASFYDKDIYKKLVKYVELY